MAIEKLDLPGWAVARKVAMVWPKPNIKITSLKFDFKMDLSSS
uniref:Uncharacterized protein n=1 Tax=Rhizophora mucronata TaxID=61149 RepID=A0A2P2QNQ5_RHIMU